MRDWNWDVTFVITEVPEKGKIAYKVKLKGGNCLGVEEDNELDSPYVLEGRYDVWEKILNGNLDPVVAVINRRLILKKGDLLNILRRASAAITIVKTIRDLAS